MLTGIRANANAEEVINFSGAFPDPSCFDRVAAGITERLPTGHSHVALQYAPSQGIATTIAAVSDQLRELDGVRPSQGAREPKVLAQQYGAGNLPVNSVNIGFVTTPQWENIHRRRAPEQPLDDSARVGRR